MTNSTIQTGQDEILAKDAPHRRPAPKWAALVDDRAIPMPRRVVTSQTIKDQAGIGCGFVLVRDNKTRNDMVVADDAELDLAQGNVFRPIPRCEAVPPPQCHEAAKLAFIVDDKWEITLSSHQTGASIRRLFELSPEAELWRDYESPDDEPIADDEAADFADGPVFRTQRVTVTVKVNNNPVTFHKRKVTGLQIKQAAIAHKVKITLDCVLYKVKSDGSLGSAIRDGEKITLKECDEFRCVTPDDNS